MNARSVLIVEDDPDIRENLAFLLEHRGYAVTVARNGREALDHLVAEEAPDVVLLDLRMPVMDGWQLRAEMLKEPRLADIPILVLSAVADIHRDSYPLGVHAHLPKPVDLDTLCAAVERFY